MKQLHRCLTFAFFFTLLLAVRGSISGAAAPLFSVSDSMTIYYQLDENDDNCSGATTLGEYVKHTLPFEWPAESIVMQRPEGVQAFKAGAVAVRTNAVSVYHTKEVNKGGTKYLCAVYGRQNHRPNDSISGFPNAQQAVNDTNGAILTHPDATDWENTQGRTIHTGAIDAQYRDDTGQYTNVGAYPWLKSIYDPISTGTPGTGMGQHGSRRWAWGESDSGQEFPKWDYRRILAHYYGEIVFVGITNPDPPEFYRGNMLQIEGIPDQGGFSMRKGEERTGIRVLYQNAGTSPWPVNGTDAQGLCPAGATYYTLLSYHLYRPDGSGPVCGSNCLGIRRIPICQSDYTVNTGEHHWTNGFRVFIPDDPAIISGQTYLLRFDVEHRNDSIWGGYPNFNWPSQDVPVTIDALPGGDEPQVIVDRPPAVVTYGELANGRFGFSWSGINADTYDLEYRSKEIGQPDYSTGFTRLLSATSAQQFSAAVGCGQDRLDWQFRLRGRNSSGEGDWVYVDTQTKAYPHPWLSYWSIGALVLDTNPGPWQRPLNVVNLGGGTFSWTATDNQSWITTYSSGQGEGPLGTVLYKPGGVGDYSGAITVNCSNFQPSVNCAAVSSFQVPVSISIREEFFTIHLPIIFKNGQ
jgi:hypothetical protein